MATVDYSPTQIRDLRESMGLNQTEFAEKIGVGQAAVSHWEQGIRAPSGSVCILLDQLSQKIFKKNNSR